MTIASGHHSNLLTGLAAFIAAGGIEATYSTSGDYTALQTGIVLGNVPQEPDRVIVLTVYDSSDDPALSDSEAYVQVRCRADGADKRKVDDIDDAVFNLLQNKLDLTLSTDVRVGQIHRVSGPASLGQDENRRWSVSSNYLVSAHRPSANRT